MFEIAEPFYSSSVIPSFQLKEADSCEFEIAFFAIF